MILVDNRMYLNLHHRELFQKLLPLESQESDQVIVEPTKKGSLTMKIKWNDKIHYLHSKYDPEHEAARLIEKWTNVEQYEQVLFVGIGLGYHIKQFANQYPAMKFSIYEPNPEVLVQFFTHINIKVWPLKNVQSIFTGTDKQQLTIEIQKLLNNGKNILVIPLTAYETIYVNELTFIMKALKEQLLHERTNVATNAAFQKRWTINSIKNFPYVMKTPNILHDVNPSIFKDKPAIIVSAGPSLSEEFENLRYIKEHGLAYIFSVGSAINALISHDIYPDAACTYDPSHLNQKVFQKVKELNISSIPLIFGSSVGFETLKDYPGPMLHMLTSQDTISPQLVRTNDNEGVKTVLDAPSIAVMTFQLLKLLECQPIILVGQNLSFKDRSRYAEGIEYDHVANRVSENELNENLMVEDVYGNMVYTNEGFKSMKNQLEMYIKNAKDTEVINTTNGGAKIQGTTFIRLSEVIKNRLKKPVVRDSWYQVNNQYDIKYCDAQLQKMNISLKEFDKLVSSLEDMLTKIQQFSNRYHAEQMEKQLGKFDKRFNQLKRNLFYQMFISPMVRIQFKKLTQKANEIRKEKNSSLKGQMVVKEFGDFIKECQLHLDFIRPYYQELCKEIDELSHNLKI
ncbi:6-hydroxymethylpterin diphosphokinase MptE-like protein [Bacillus sp. FSL W8-0223]|uniref:motility associated factor glycosyltransferase family protein n=1 Tax=Bacillus sp. FSL W8-0223 TaxID=2954595 RepID=UPI0030F93C48